MLSVLLSMYVISLISMLIKINLMDSSTIVEESLFYILNKEDYVND